MFPSPRNQTSPRMYNPKAQMKPINHEPTSPQKTSHSKGCRREGNFFTHAPDQKNGNRLFSLPNSSRAVLGAKKHPEFKAADQVGSKHVGTGYAMSPNQHQLNQTATANAALSMFDENFKHNTFHNKKPSAQNALNQSQLGKN